MKVLVTGATGFIGGNLARELCARGYEVRALARPGSNSLTVEGTSIERVEGDILDRVSVQRAVAGCEAVFHCAAVYTFWSRDPQAVRRANVEGTVNVLQCATPRRSGAHRLHQHRFDHRPAPFRPVAGGRWLVGRRLATGPWATRTPR